MMFFDYWKHTSVEMRPQIFWAFLPERSTVMYEKKFSNPTVAEEEHCFYGST